MLFEAIYQFGLQYAKQLNKRIQVILDWNDIGHEIWQIHPLLGFGVEEQKSMIVFARVLHVERIPNIDIDARPEDVDQLGDIGELEFREIVELRQPDLRDPGINLLLNNTHLDELVVQLAYQAN